MSHSIEIGSKKITFTHTAANKDIHMFINGSHDPVICAECIMKGSLTSKDSDETILANSIMLAMDRGFKWEDVWSALEDEDFTWDLALGDGDILLHSDTFHSNRADNAWTMGVETLIFHPAFAKALWGEEDDTSLALSGMDTTIPWEYHLQQIFIAPNRYEYLADNLYPGDKN